MGRPTLVATDNWLKNRDPALAWQFFGDQMPFDLQNYIESVEISFTNISVGPGIFNGASFNYYANTHNINAFSINFYADANQEALRKILEWKKLVVDQSTGLHGYPSEYKYDLTFVLCDTAGSEKMRVKQVGCWPSDTGSLQLAYNSSERLVIAQQFSIDSQEIQ